MAQKIDLDRVRQLARLARQSGLSKLISQEDGVRVTVTVEPEQAVAAVAAPAASAPSRARRAPAAQQPPKPEDLGLKAIVSPMVGVFYRAPSPESPNYVEVGGRIEEGDIVGLVEAMKVFNEINAELGGEIVEIVVANQESVSLGQTLMWVRP